MKNRLFTPDEAESTFSCMHCGFSLVPGENVPWKIIDSIRKIGLHCKFCATTDNDDFLGETVDEYGSSWNPKYAEYLRSPQWKTLRHLAIERAGGRCQICNSDLLLQVHHRKYPMVLGWEMPQDLTVLCRRCHDLFHNVKVVK